ncbi:whey acidic protein-like [Moschus berezovskii]|uniref:whey acidic protein-like n=1 Tax=Moschus berezovskii TaxID=68408 RepID=UPI002444C085|nr:whey acidic protein-like [Moschus berezovskii]
MEEVSPEKEGHVTWAFIPPHRGPALRAQEGPFWEEAFPVPQGHKPPPAICLPPATIPCLATLALTLLSLKAALALAPALSLPGQAVCPEVSSSEKDSCTASCVNDESCPQGTKCCARSPCSRSCVAPLMAPFLKAGRCPWVPLLAPKLCLEGSECSRDDQCRDNLKCCFSSCAMRCMVPTTEDPPQ